MTRYTKQLTTLARALVLAAFCTALFPTVSLAGPPKGKPSSGKPSSKSSFGKPTFVKPSYIKPANKSFGKPFGKPSVKSPKVVLVNHHRGHRLFPVAYPVFVANSVHTLYYADENGATQVYGQYVASTDVYGNINWGGLVEAQTELTNAGYQCWIDDLRPTTDG